MRIQPSRHFQRLIPRVDGCQHLLRRAAVPAAPAAPDSPAPSAPSGRWPPPMLPPRAPATRTGGEKEKFGRRNGQISLPPVDKFRVSMRWCRASAQARVAERTIFQQLIIFGDCVRPRGTFWLENLFYLRVSHRSSESDRFTIHNATRKRMKIKNLQYRTRLDKKPSPKPPAGGFQDFGE